LLLFIKYKGTAQVDTYTAVGIVLHGGTAKESGSLDILSACIKT